MRAQERERERENFPIKRSPSTSSIFFVERDARARMKRRMKRRMKKKKKKTSAAFKEWRRKKATEASCAIWLHAR